jgi:predicted nucleic acid-binding protein
MMSSAVLDACVLYSAPLRDFLLWLARRKAFVPYWTEKIRDEWIRNLLEKRPDLKPEKLERTRLQMDVHFPNSLVQGYESITQTLQLPDPKDWHVLAAAIYKEAKYIVTFNLNDFPNTVLQSENVEAVSPDEFVQKLIPTTSPLIIDAARDNRLNLKYPPKTVEQYFETLEQQKLFKTVEFLRQHKDKI